MKIFFHTLGCKVNQYESAAMAALLTERGHTIVADSAECDAAVINTCAVTEESVRKSRRFVKQLRTHAPDAVIAVCGCWPQISPDEPEKCDVDIVFGSGDRLSLIDELEKAVRGERISRIDNALARREYELLPAVGSGERTRASLKIEDGCSNFCAYCVIPYARGPVRSMPLEKVSDSAENLAALGYREIVITGIEICSYGRDLGESITPADAIAAAASAAPDARIRLGSLEPSHITREFTDRLKALPNLCHHFHISLQSGSSEILRLMNRKYDAPRALEAIALLREAFPDCALTTDLIVGFPGETEELFSETLDFLQKARFSKVHVFPYSPRPGTPAARRGGRLDKAALRERAKIAGAICEKIREEWLNSLVGTEQHVLFEQFDGEFWHGYSENYAPIFAHGATLHNKICTVLIKKVEKGSLFGDLLL